jgi:hypothetical protein
MEEVKAIHSSRETVVTGRLELASRNIRSLAEFEIPAIAVTLDVSKNLITDFDGFCPSARLETLVIDHNPVLSFQGFPNDHGIKHFSALQTPISELPRFRELALLAIGDQLLSINGESVKKSERKAISEQIWKERFFRQIVPATRKADDSLLRLNLAEYVRRGFICDIWPGQLQIIDTLTNTFESSPFSVKIMRIAKILHKDESSINFLMNWIFAPPEPRIAIKTIKTLNRKLEKQQGLINFMTTELEKLRRACKAKARRVETRKSKTKLMDFEISDATRAMYAEIVQETGQTLLDNAEYVMKQRVAEQNTVVVSNDYDGLRCAVMELLNIDGDVSDQVLTRALLERC